MDTRRRVIIVGGGVSGLAAGVHLAAHGTPATVLEQKPVLGGRAYSFRDQTTGDEVDNGQHVLISGYRRTREFLRRIGTEKLLAIQPLPLLLFHHPVRGFRTFALPPLPSPLHLIAGTLATSLLPFRDRWGLLRAGLTIRVDHPSTASLTIDEWLTSLGQSAEAKRSFWEPLAIAIMNEHITRASAEVFVRTLRVALLEGWNNSALAIPRVGLSELYVNRAEAFIKSNGGEVLCSHDVISLEMDGTCATGVRLKDGTHMGADAIILALPWYRLLMVLPEQLVRPYSHLDAMASSPIVSIHLWFAEDFMPHEFVGVIGRTIQWVFNKRRLNAESAPGGHLSVVISGAYEQVGMTNDELVLLALSDLKNVYPTCPSSASHSLVIREKRATLSLTPEVEGMRPDQRTPIPNVFLAGDWTKTGLPSTIEGAIMSGERCAELAARCSNTSEGDL